DDDRGRDDDDGDDDRGRDDDDGDGGRGHTASPPRVSTNEATGDSLLRLNGEPRYHEGVITYWLENESDETIDPGTVYDSIHAYSADGNWEHVDTLAYTQAIEPGSHYNGEFVLAEGRLGGHYTAMLYFDQYNGGPTAEVEWDEEGFDFGDLSDVSIKMRFGSD
ncbi:MAG: hypothetical protein ACRD0U_06680, partial [Acidimicrobiales bacterium]